MRELKPGDIVHCHGLYVKSRKLRGRNLGYGEMRITQSSKTLMEYIEVGNKILTVDMLN